MVADDVRELLRKACDKAGSLRAFARAHRISAAYVSDVIASKREPGPAICDALGLEAERGETVYKRKSKP